MDCSQPIFVTILAGPNLQKFVVHKSVICHYSSFFRKAFDRTFIEGQTQEMKLEDVDTDLFGILVNWCYSQKFDHMERDITLVELGRLWTLGDRFLMPTLQNNAMASILKPNIKTSREMEPNRLCVVGVQELMEYAYNAYHDDHPLKRAVIGGFLHVLTGDRGSTRNGEYGGLIEHYFGKGPAQDLLKEFLKHVKAEVPDHISLTECFVPVPKEQ
jgi:hypothetical protein